MSTKHTPGPWNCQRASAADRHIVCAENQPLDICVLSNRNKGASEINANALLIAAAPELLELAKDALGMVGLPIHPYDAAAFRARCATVISKATVGAAP